MGVVHCASAPSCGTRAFLFLHKKKRRGEDLRCEIVKHPFSHMHVCTKIVCAPSRFQTEVEQRNEQVAKGHGLNLKALGVL